FLVLHLRQLRAHRLDVGPVLLVLGALFDPRLERRDLGRSERIALERHALGRVFFENLFQEATVFGVAGDDGEAVRLERLQRAGPRLQVEAAFFLVGAVTLVAAVGQDGADVAIETDRRLRLSGPVAGT